MAAVVALEDLLAARTLWHAGRSARQAADGEPTGHAALDALLPQGGWPRRALTELLLPADGVGELALLMPTLARCTRAGERVAVIAPPYVPYAPAWQAAGLDLSRLCIVEAAPRDALWAFEQCLRSGACAAVLGWPQQAGARALRRLQVAADSGRCLGFALRDRRHAANASPAALRLEAVRGERGIAWHVRKCRGGPVPSTPFVPERDSIFIGVPPVAPFPAREPSAPSPASGGRSQGDACVVAPSPVRGGGPGRGQAGIVAPRASASPPSQPSPASGGRSQGDACVVAPSPVRGGGPGWGQPRVAASHAFDARPSASSDSAQHELLLVQAPAPSARD